MHLDGTGLDSLTAFSAIGGTNPTPTISPDGGSDGRWVLMSTVYMGAILVEVSSGTIVPLTALGADLTQVRDASFVR